MAALNLHNREAIVGFCAGVGHNNYILCVLE